MFIGGLNLRMLWSHGWAQLGIIFGFIPASPGWILGVFISYWAQSVVKRPHIMRAFLQRQRMRAERFQRVSPPPESVDLDAVRAEVDGPSLAMIVMGLLIAIGHTVAVVLAFGMPNNDLTVGIGALGIVTGVGMFLGGLNLRTLNSRGWAQLGIISGMIPSGPGFVLALPISLWSLAVFNRPHMPQAFLQWRRERSSETGLSASSRYSRKAIIGAFWAGLFVLLAFPALFVSGVRVNGPDTALRAGPPAMLMVVALPILLAPIGTTVLGGMAISDIRRSQGRIGGIGLAVADLLAFPLIILYGAIFAVFMYFFSAGTGMNAAMSTFVSLGATGSIGTGIAAPIVKSVWQRATESPSSPSSSA
jgi:hypothetical protein